MAEAQCRRCGAVDELTLRGGVFQCRDQDRCDLWVAAIAANRRFIPRDRRRLIGRRRATLFP